MRYLLLFVGQYLLLTLLPLEKPIFKDPLTDKYGFKGHLVMGLKELYFVNGLIRMFKPKKILEIGVCAGAMSAAILNSIKSLINTRIPIFKVLLLDKELKI